MGNELKRKERDSAVPGGEYQLQDLIRRSKSSISFHQEGSSGGVAAQYQAAMRMLQKEGHAKSVKKLNPPEKGKGVNQSEFVSVGTLLEEKGLKKKKAKK